MYRVLIVDDERLIREGLRGLIDWPSLGFQVEAVASDGVEALEILAETPVDLVIADIRMPRMDGLEFLETLRARGSSVRYLVLSGFAEFEYAQRAAALRIDGYLLKPVDEDELVKRLSEVRRQLDAGRFSALTLVDGTDRVPPAYDWGRWQVLLLTPLSATGQVLTLDPATELRLRQAAADRGWGEVFHRPPLLGLLLRQVYPRGHNLDRLARDLGTALGPGVPLFAGAVGPIADTPAAVADSAHQAQTLLACRFFSPPGTLVWEAPSEPTAAPGPDLDLLAEKLALALESAQAGTLRTVLAALAAELAATRSEDTVREGLARIASGAIDRYLGHESRSSTLRARTTAWIADLWRQPFLATLVDDLAGHLEALMVKERSPDASQLVQKMLDLLETRYAENLKLETLADIFHYNSAYLGKLFRSKTGEYFNTALDKVRIRHAQELLRQGLKVYQVAELVGYKYVDYFHAKFKKYTGLSPSQFKDG